MIKALGHDNNVFLVIHVVVLFLLKIKTFRLYRTWKTFYVWRKMIIQKKFKSATNYVQAHLFICDSILGEALIEIRSLSSVFFDYSFMDATIVQNLTLFDFSELQVNEK